ncbi:hypothetical protein IID23_04350, partial [Patescibacteria group bacterium]|nr:hypothetical protein [Patescibacteria group bacterium]
DTTSPYSASFTDVDEGNYEIKVIVYDSKNKTEEETIDIEVIDGGGLGLGWIQSGPLPQNFILERRRFA